MAADEVDELEAGAGGCAGAGAGADAGGCAGAGAADAAGGGSTAAGDYGLAQALLDAMDSAGADCETDRGGGPVTCMHTHANMHKARLRLVF